MVRRLPRSGKYNSTSHPRPRANRCPTCMRFGNSSRYFGMKRALLARCGAARGRTEGPRPRQPLRLAHEGAYEGAAAAVRFPVYVEAGAVIGIGQGYGWHGVGELGERGIEGHFVSAEMIFVVDR